MYNDVKQFQYTDDAAIFIFHERLQVVMNFKAFEISIMKDDKVIARVDYKGEPFSLCDLQLVFKQATESAEKL